MEGDWKGSSSKVGAGNAAEDSRMGGGGGGCTG